MRPTRPQPPPSGGDIVDVVSRHVTGLELIGPDELPAWLAALPVPAGWQIGRAENSPVQPTRTTVHRRDHLAGWDACETINVFRFKGVPPHDVIRSNVDCNLRVGGAQDITIHPLQTPADATMMTAVRSSGYLTLADQQSIWAQYSTYIAGDNTQGLLVEHGMFVVSDRQAGLHDDTTKLSSAIHDAFVSTIAKAPKQDVHASSSLDIGDLPPSKETRMAAFRVQPFEDIGVPAILVNADRDGMRMFQSAVRSAHEDGAATFESDAIKHQIVRQDGAADIELQSHTVVWRFDDARLVEMLNLIEPLVDIEGPGHQYVDDLNSPVETLVLSVDEYIHAAPFGEFPQLLPVPPLR
jgi:hypothetical protein